jgi:hypothetical protein
VIEPANDTRRARRIIVTLPFRIIAMNATGLALVGGAMVGALWFFWWKRPPERIGPPTDTATVLEGLSTRIDEQEFLTHIEAVHAGSEVERIDVNDNLFRASSEAGAEIETRRDIDSEWHSIPITDFSPAERFSASIHSVSALELFRNRFLNPADIYIPRQARDQLTAYLKDRGTALNLLLASVNGIATQEMTLLVDQGALKGIEYKEYLARLSEKERQSVEAIMARERAELRAQLVQRGLAEADIQRNLDAIEVVSPSKVFAFEPFAHQRRGSTYYACRLVDLPSACRAMDAFKVGVADTFWKVVTAFQEAGALDSPRVSALMSSLEEQLDQRYPTRQGRRR